jgi:TonB family protein
VYYDRRMNNRALTLAAVVVLLACASSNPKVKDPEPAEPVNSNDDKGPKGSVAGGSLAPVDVKKAIVARKEDVKACYHALLEKQKKASGKVVIRFTIGEDGKVEDTVIMNETTLPNDTAQCIADILKTIEFPKPTGGKVRITYPWEFTAE